MSIDRSNFEQTPFAQGGEFQQKEPNSILTPQDIKRINSIGELSQQLRIVEESTKMHLDTKKTQEARANAERLRNDRKNALDFAISKIEQLPYTKGLLASIKVDYLEIIARYDKQLEDLSRQGIPTTLMTAEEKQAYYDAKSRRDNFINFLQDQYGIEEPAAEEIYKELATRLKSKSEQARIEGENAAQREKIAKDQEQIGKPRIQPERKETEKLSIDELTREILAEAENIPIRPEDRNANGQLLVYPGGPVSSLPEKQWRMVRTRTFKEWFGDWENRPVIFFKTARGSIYTYDSEGKTTRYKTETGVLKERQDITVFVDLSPDEEEEFLNAYLNNRETKSQVYIVERQADDSAKILRDVSQVTNPDRVYLVIVQNNKIIKDKKASLRPVIGWSPFDTRQFQRNGETFTERHLGNKVVEIIYDNSQISKVLNANGEPLLLDNKDGSTSFVRIIHPFNTTEDYVRNWVRENNLEGHPYRFVIFMDYLRSQGYDGLMINGVPVRDSATGRHGCDEAQILRIGK
jgi:hypothetical protein